MEKSQTMHRHAQRKQSKPFIKTWVYGCRPRPLDLDLHPTKSQTQERGTNKRYKTIKH